MYQFFFDNVIGVNHQFENLIMNCDNSAKFENALKSMYSYKSMSSKINELAEMTSMIVQENLFVDCYVMAKCRRLHHKTRLRFY